MFASRDEVAGALDALEAAVSVLADLDVGGLSNPERLDVLRRMECCTRKGEAIGQRVLGAWWEQREVSEFGGQHSFDVLADALHLSRAEAAKRFRTAIELAPRMSFTGEPLAPELPATADACGSGSIGDAHVQVIRRFLRDLPNGVDPQTREQAEAQLARRQPRWVRTRCARSPPDSRPTSTPTGTARNATGPGGAGSPSVIRARTR